MVRDFHSKFGLTINEAPVLSPADDKLRVELIREEASELSDALANGDLVEIADALGDLLYVIYGAGVTYGIDLEPVVAEIHRSNMSKLWKTSEVMDRAKGTAAEHQGGREYKFVDGVVASVVDFKSDRQWLVKRADGKVLKSPSYSPADLAEVM